MSQGSFTFQPIGIVHSCFKEKFGIPRQPNLAPAAKAELKLLPPYNRPEAVEGLEQSSHIWIQFVFHECLRDEWKPTVRPPRLGGNQRMGVFATRAPYRPNPIGLSVTKLEGIDTRDGVTLHLSGIDLLDGTPVLDIKPYVPYVDSLTDAENGLASESPLTLSVRFSSSAKQFCQRYQQTSVIDLSELITQVLQQDPRPAYHQYDPERFYAMRLLDFDIQWRYVKSRSEPISIEVTAITPTR